MPSGKYGALTGAISRMQMLENINRSLANTNTTGYKKGVEVFEAQLAEAKASRDGISTNFALVSDEVIDFTPGQINKTGNNSHLAINGAGFFRLQQEDGDIVYSRRGSFSRNPAGELVTANGSKLLGAGDTPLNPGDQEFEVSSSGSVLVNGQPVATIPVYTFDDTSGLRRGQEGVFLAPADAEAQLSEKPEIMQGYLEASNVNVMHEMGRMVYTLRAFEASQKALMAYDEMDRKLAELGSLQ